MRGEFGFGQKVIHDGEKYHMDFFDVFMVVGFGRNVVQGWREISLLALSGRSEDVGQKATLSLSKPLIMEEFLRNLEKGTLQWLGGFRHEKSTK